MAALQIAHSPVTPLGVGFGVGNGVSVLSSSIASALGLLLKCLSYLQGETNQVVGATIFVSEHLRALGDRSQVFDSKQHHCALQVCLTLEVWAHHCSTFL